MRVGGVARTFYPASVAGACKYTRALTLPFAHVHMYTGLLHVSAGLWFAVMLCVISTPGSAYRLGGDQSEVDIRLRGPHSFGVDDSSPIRFSPHTNIHDIAWPRASEWASLPRDMLPTAVSRRHPNAHRVCV